MKTRSVKKTPSTLKFNVPEIITEEPIYEHEEYQIKTSARLFPKTHNLDYINNLNDEYRLIYSKNKYIKPTTPGRLSKTKSLGSIKLNSLQPLTQRHNRTEPDSSPLKKKLEKSNIMNNPLSRNESSKMLFHDVFLIEEKEKLFNDINNRDKLNTERKEQQPDLVKEESLNYEREKLYFYNQESRKLGKKDKHSSPDRPVKTHIDDSMFRELILLNWEANGTTERIPIAPKPQSKLIKMQSLKDLELVVGVNLGLEKSSKEIHLLVKLAVCREENQKFSDSCTIWKKLLDIARKNKDGTLNNLALNHIAVNSFKRHHYEEAKNYCLKHLENSSENDYFTCWYNMAIIYRILGKQDKCQEFLKKALKWAANNNDYYWQCLIHIQWGLNYAFKGENTAYSESHFNSALKILEHNLNEQILHLKTLDLIGNVYYNWRNWEKASVYTGLTLKLYIDSDNFEYEDKYDNELRVRSTLAVTKTKFDDMNKMLENHFTDKVYERINLESNN